MDATTKRVLYAKNPELKLKPASTTKLMTALVVVEKAKLNDIVTVSKRAVGTAPTKVGFKAGDKVTVETLLYAALMKSANDAAVALAEAVAGSERKFVRLMNHKALALGLKDTRFVNPHGLPGRGQHITAYDLARIMGHAIKNPVLREILGTRVRKVATEKGKSIFIKSTNKLLWFDEALLGGKTGYTRRARHCFAGVSDRGKESVIVALLGTPQRDLLWKEAEALLDFGYRVKDNMEEPVVYLTRSSIHNKKIVKASHTRKMGIRSSMTAKLKKTRKKPIYR
jgi:D-alanyl-D-alanine carboxypeptidase (penicillin-binding protein 5/6)